MSGAVRGGGPIPLTPAQARIWRLEQAGFDGSTHLITTSRRLTGPLDARAMAQALTTVIRRHEALHIAITGGHQSIGQPDIAAAWEQADFTHLSTEARKTAARQWADELLKRPFRLDRPPALRIGLGRLGERDHLMLFCVHHIICDASSLAIVRHELLTAYQGFLGGTEPALPPPATQFPDYAAWLAGGGSPHRDEDREYWRHQLCGAPPVTAPPPDRPRSAAMGARASTRGGRVTVPLPPGFGDAVAQAARRQRCTSFILVQAALAVVLARRAGQSTVVIGTPVDNRDRPDLEHTVGMFVNLLALRTDLSGDPTVPELLARVRSTTIDGLAHRHLPFDEVVEALGVAVDAGHHPVFQVQLVTDPALNSARTFGQLRIAPGYKPTPDARFDLTVLYDSGTPKLYADYNLDLYDASTVEDLLHHMAAVMRTLTGSAEGSRQNCWS